MTTARLSLLFRVDAVANVALGVGALALLLAPDVLGVPRAALAVGGAVLLLNAVDLARTGRLARPEPSDVRRSALVDLAAAGVLVAVAAVGLAGQSDAARWVLAAVGDVCLVVGGLKLLGLRSLRAVHV